MVGDIPWTPEQCIPLGNVMDIIRKYQKRRWGQRLVRGFLDYTKDQHPQVYQSAQDWDKHCGQTQHPRVYQNTKNWNLHRGLRWDELGKRYVWNITIKDGRVVAGSAGYQDWWKDLYGCNGIEDEAYLDFNAGRDCLYRGLQSSWWEWSSGSRPFFWRW